MPHDPTPRAVAVAASSSGGNRLWTFIRILNVRLRFIGLMVIVGVITAKWDTVANYYDRWRRPGAAATQTASGVEFFCPMHPAVVRSEPASCPICGMPLSKRLKSDRPPLPEGVLAQVHLTPFKVQMGRIATSPVEYRMLSRETRTVGIIEYDETRVAHASARIKGRLEKLYVNYIGQRVEKGGPLFSIYSPDLLVTQEQLLSGKRALDAHTQAGAVAREMDQSLFDGARRKLLLLGITEQQIDDILQRGTAETTINILSPVAGIVTEKTAHQGHYVEVGEDVYTVADLGNVWLQAKIFEEEFAGMEIGTAVAVTCAAFPEELFAGRVTFVAFDVDSATRTIAARVEIANPGYQLRPGMYATASIRLPAGKVTVLASATQPIANVAAATGPASEATEPGIDTTALARAYLTLSADYARDKTNSASAFAQASRDFAGRCPPALRKQAAEIADQAAALSGKDLKGQRSEFKSLSQRVIALLRAQPPRGMPLYTAHCPMVEADWVQDAPTISNPYDSGMPRCGEITGRIVASALMDEERFATGYFCPVYPDRLFDQPAECPIDKFPMKYVRVEKVPAIPESAVINSGARQVVYRESAPGVFDMIEVRLGSRAGEFYPVLAGLSVGDHVATAGAFLVDAENRLNPAAAAQYFGASGSR